MTANASASQELPRLNWPTDSSDTTNPTPITDSWLNVKTDLTGLGYSANAAGDGSTDDTDALQDAFSELFQDTRNSTDEVRVIYLPEGDYIIKDTIEVNFPNAGKDAGNVIVGTGRGTKLIWDGAAGEPMIVFNGLKRSRIVGIDFVAKTATGNAAGVGIDHRPVSPQYQTHVTHEHLGFSHFSIAGIRGGYNTLKNTSEVRIVNCLFKYCQKGISLLTANYYNYSINKCEFISCPTGIYAEKGNIYLRNSHFENSTERDIYIRPQSHSIRRCTSVGSKMFIDTGVGVSNSLSFVVEDCIISGWTGGNDDEAIRAVDRGPITLLNTQFINGPVSGNPPVLLASPTYTQTCLFSNCIPATQAALIDSGVHGSVTEIPAGERDGLVPSENYSGFQSEVYLPDAVIHVVDDHAGDIQAAINEAIAADEMSVVYIPAGIYNISSTININGGNFYMLGDGFSTILKWTGTNGPTIEIVDPENLTIQGMLLQENANDYQIVQTSNNAVPSYARYIDVHCRTRSELLNMQLKDLPREATVHVENVIAKLDVDGSSEAKIFGDFNHGGIFVSGATPKTGFLGVDLQNVALSPYGSLAITLPDYAVSVEDNQNLTIGNLYVEQTLKHIELVGDTGSLPPGTVLTPGEVTIFGTKAHSFIYNSVDINNYNGELFYGMGSYLCHDNYDGDGQVYDSNYEITHSGTEPFDIIFAGTSFLYEPPVFIENGSGMSQTLIGNIVPLFNTNQTGNNNIPNSTVADTGSASAATAGFDRIALLGEYDLYRGSDISRLAIWNMQQAVGGEIFDASGKDNHGTIVNETAIVNDDEMGLVAEFDGVNDYITTSINRTFEELTFAAWVKAPNDEANFILNDSANDLIVFKTHSNGKVYLLLGGQKHNENGIISLTSIPHNEWAHIAATWHHEEGFRVYINGVLDRSGNTNIDEIAFTDILIGKRNNTFHSIYEGRMDDLGIWDRALSGSEIEGIYEASNQFGFWTMSDYDSTNGIIGDSSPKAYHATTQGDITVVDDTRGAVAYLDGSGDYIDTHITKEFTELTFASWVKVPNTVQHTIIGDTISLDKVFYIKNGLLHLALGGWNDGQDAIRGIGFTGTIPVDEWVHLAVTWHHQNGFTSYVNGEVVDTAATTKTSIKFDDMVIGVRRPPYPHNWFEGHIDDVGIWSKELTTDQIKLLAQDALFIDPTYSFMDLR